MKTATGKPIILSDNAFPVVGIGASAGGLDAFKKFITAIPEDSGMAYILVQHLDPNHESILPELLQKVTPLRVLEIADDMHVSPNEIYILPSNGMLIANDGVLELSLRPEKSKKALNLPIDLFFNSLADVHQRHAIGVVLSGTGADGTLGLKAIKAKGGTTFAQDEESSAFPNMPNSAIMAGAVDFILPPWEMPSKILAVIAQSNLSDEEKGKTEETEEEAFTDILLLLRLRKGTDFTNYKQPTVRRRILRRMSLQKCVTATTYLEYLRSDNEELDALYQDMLIPVTSFFRDTHVFEHLCETVFPHLLENRRAGQPIRIWVAGCSTGQEVYSIAMCLKEFLGEHVEKVQLFATDLSEVAIAKARSGIYTKAETEGISAERLHQFFVLNDGKYQVIKQVRALCIFAAHNFLKDPPFGKIDFITCRNVLIYMSAYLQKKALTIFHYALNPKGMLLLGKSETSSSASSLFLPTHKTAKLFTRKDVPASFIHLISELNERKLPALATSTTNKAPMLTDFEKAADDIILSKYTPAGVVVNDALDIVHFRGNTAPYLSQAAGKPSHNLLKMAKEGFAFDLRNLLHKAKKVDNAVLQTNLSLQTDNGVRSINVEAIALPNMEEPHYLVLFHEQHPITQAQNATKASSKQKKAVVDERVSHLEQELAKTHEDMRSITEDMEATNEELQSANEELLSGSEEMQSVNEELETSKEELQSTNEELTVLNQELNSLNELVIEARDYQKSLKEKLEIIVKERTQSLSEANDLLLKKNEDLLKMNKGLESFAYISSHDMQEPLRKIQTFAGLILQKEHERLSDQGKDYFHRMHSAAQRMQVLIEDLITYARADVHEHTYEKVHLQQVMQEVKMDLADIIIEKKAIIQVNDLCEANINPSQFRQVISNLMTNALKFSRPDVAPIITIKAQCIKSEAIEEDFHVVHENINSTTSYCHISFEDNGIGLEPQYCDKIFELFMRLHGKSEYPGTGIGLAIVKKIIDNHNGIIKVTSEIDKGTCFDIFIPDINSPA